MDAAFAMLLGERVEWWPIALGALAAAIGSLGVALVVRNWGHQDKLETDAQNEITTGLSQLHNRLDSEAQLRRDKDDALGDDIQDTRGALDHLCGTLKEPRPTYRSKK